MLICSFDFFSLGWLRRPVAVFIVAAGALPALALDGSAPFGFAWGPLDKIPKPALALRDANVTVLFYRRDLLPAGEMPDTEVVSLDVCKKEGLQKISWASRAFSSSEAAAKFAQVVALGVQKCGEGKPTLEGSVSWENGRIEVLSVLDRSFRLGTVQGIDPTR
ncbi:hypothetical protein ACVWZV_009427 [Bradyrhizobium sp. GM5.1]|uniref:hypothetical protein n=1 Tax=Bradyrhizobium sp. 156 TaxID=2782630 RepID=UPI001FFA497E|nr:hypothetical protein [Bradyrhizobium sp. 156]MCK1326466.1 hypothetical protein [Bradyrhizobium sp. 156]